MIENLIFSILLKFAIIGITFATSIRSHRVAIFSWGYELRVRESRVLVRDQSRKGAPNVRRDGAY